jgi:DNA-binding CsgD family transcriptional regulator
MAKKTFRPARAPKRNRPPTHRRASKRRTPRSTRPKRATKRRSRRVPPRVEQRSPRWSETHKRALRVLALMRHGHSLAEATRLEHIKPDTFRRHVGGAVRQERANGRIRVAPTDRLVRHMNVPGPNGPIAVSPRGIKQAREFSQYANAVLHYKRTGDPTRLLRFEGRTFVTSGGQVVPFMTDRDSLIRVAQAGLPGPDLYR